MAPLAQRTITNHRLLDESEPLQLALEDEIRRNAESKGLPHPAPQPHHCQSLFGNKGSFCPMKGTDQIDVNLCCKRESLQYKDASEHRFHQVFDHSVPV